MNFIYPYYLCYNNCMENHDDYVLSILKELDIFTDLDFQSLRDLINMCEQRVFERGEVIFEEDSLGNSMMIISSGEVRISQKSDTETEEALVILKKGDLFGEMALVEDLPRSAVAIAHTNVIVLEISREKFMQFIDENPKSGVNILIKLAKILSSRLRETDTKLKAFVSLTKWI